MTFGIVVGIFCSLLFKCSGGTKSANKSTSATNTVVVHTSDTIVKYKPGAKQVVKVPYPVLVGDTTTSSRTYLFSINRPDLAGKFSVKSTAPVYDFLADYAVTAKEITIRDSVKVFTTVTEKIEAKRRTNLLFGSHIKYSLQNNNFQGVGVSLAFKTRRDFMFEVGYDQNFTMSSAMVFGVKIPLFHTKR